MAADQASTDEPMKVLVVTPGAELYGSDRMLLEVVRGLHDAGHDVTVATSESGPLLPLLQEAGASVAALPTTVLRKSAATPRGFARFASETLGSLPALVRYLRALSPDVLYVNTTVLPTWCTLGATLRIPTIVHVHEAESGLSRPVRTVLMSAVMPARTVVFNSRTSLRLARRDLGRALGATTVAPNAVPFTSEAVPARHDLTGAVRLVYVGRLSERKGVHTALEAVALLRADGRDVTLDVVGESFRGNEAYVHALDLRAQDADLRGHVHFHGFQPRPDTFVRDADIVLVPSVGPESFGNTLVEGIGQARPTVATTQEGLTEAADGFDSVSLVPPSDAAALAEAIRTHIDHWPTSRERAWRDAVTARERHHPSTFRRTVVEVVADAAGRGRRRSAAPPRCTPADLVGDARVLVVAPHLDDAVLSAHALLELGDQVDVLTVLDGIPNPPVRTGWDRLCGFADSDVAMRHRREENLAALSQTPHHLISLGLLDSQYLRAPRGADDSAALANAITTWVAAQPGEVAIAVPAGAGRLPRGRDDDSDAQVHVSGHRSRRARLRQAVGPLGRSVLDVRARFIAKHTKPLQHEDHIWARDVVTSNAFPDASIVFYEELPYRWARRADSAVGGMDLRPAPVVRDVLVDRMAKARGVSHYRSQLAYLHAPLGPLTAPHGLPRYERYWVWSRDDR